MTYNQKAIHQTKNVHLLAVEDAAVLEVVIFKQVGSDNQSIYYHRLMMQLIYYIHFTYSLCMCVCLCATFEISGTGHRNTTVTFTNDHPCSCSSQFICTKPSDLCPSNSVHINLLLHLKGWYGASSKWLVWGKFARNLDYVSIVVFLRMSAYFLSSTL